MKYAILLALALIGLSAPAFAENATLVCYKAPGTSNCVPVTAATPLPVTGGGGGGGGTSSNFAATFPTAGTAAGAIYNSIAQTYVTGQMVPLQTDVNGNLKIAIVSGGGSGGTASSFGSAFPATGTAIGLTNGTNMVAWAASSNYGTSPGAIAVPAVNAFMTNPIPAGTNVIGHVINDAGSAVIGHVIADTGSTTAVTALPAIPAGTNVIGHVINDAGSAVIGHVIADTGSTTAVTALPATPAGTNLIGKVGIDQTTPGTTNGVSVTNTNANGRATAANSSPVVPVAAASTAGAIAANNTTAVVVKGSAGTLFGVQVYGIGSAPAYLKIYNAATATCGSGTPVKRLMIPAASTAANGAGSNISFGPGLAMGTGITYCVTTGITDTDTTAPAASTFLVNVDYE